MNVKLIELMQNSHTGFSQGRVSSSPVVLMGFSSPVRAAIRSEQAMLGEEGEA